MDNYATHKHPTVKSWLARHPRFHLHFTPTSSSWLNLVERFFRDLTEDVVREGSFGSVRELVRTMETYLAERNLAPKRYVWKKKGEEILAKIARARTAQARRHSYDPLFSEHYTSMMRSVLAKPPGMRPSSSGDFAMKLVSMSR